MGCCSREGMFVYGLCSSGNTSYVLRDETIIPFNLHVRKGSIKYERIKEEILKHYFGNKNPFANVDDILKVSNFRVLKLIKLIIFLALY